MNPPAWTLIGLFVLSLFVLSTQTALAAPRMIKWTEEVQLADGKVVQVKRKEEHGWTGFPVQKRGRTKYHELCYSPLNLHWKSKPAYRPETFEIVDGKAYVKVTLGGCFECRDHDYPDTNAIYFRWSRTTWQKIGYSDYPKGLRLNLLSNTHYDDDGSRDARGLVTLHAKESRDFGLLRSLKAGGVSGRNEPPYKKETCEKCKKIQMSGDPPNSNVFLPSKRTDCE